ncbi:hypothetical protein [Flavobacterium sp.]|uniref:hypothetical protein n=1 Tax=Flavobacterium sp. TaxID=239 RepID=UPI00262BEDE1|nr:hypothetical protein [Flavobacterium sp.]
MARVIAPFKIVGTIGDLNFYMDKEKENNYVRAKGKTGVSSKEFMQNPVFTKARNHGKEFGRCTIKAKNFRFTALYLFKRAKDGSFAGRTNRLMLDVMNEDTENQPGERTVEIGMKSSDAKDYFVGFEGNKARPLKKVLKAKWHWNEETSECTIPKFHPSKHLDWPEEAEFAHIAIARTNWNYVENKFTTIYSEEIIFEKEEKPSNLKIKTAIPEGNHLQVTFLFIGFSIKHRKTTKELKRINNTISIIWCK